MGISEIEAFAKKQNKIGLWLGAKSYNMIIPSKRQLIPEKPSKHRHSPGSIQNPPIEATSPAFTFIN